MISDILLNLTSKAYPDFFFFSFIFFSKIDVCVIKIVKLLGRAQATMDEAVCRAQSWLQRVR